MSAVQYILIGTLLMLALEAMAGRHKGLYSWREVSLLAACFALGRVVVMPLVGFVAAAGLGWLFPHGKGWASAAPLWASVPLLLLLSEFCFYWVHRLAHAGQRDARLRWLWLLHRTHHSGPYLNVITTLRVNPYWFLVQPNVWLTAVAVWSGQGLAVVIVQYGLIYGWNLITHSNFRWDDAVRAHAFWGKSWAVFEGIFITPGLHHTHHGWGKDGGVHRNFAVMLSLYDRLFGTLHIPQGRPAHYGLPGPVEPWGESVLYPLVRPKR